MTDTNALADRLQYLADGIGDCVDVSRALRTHSWFGTAHLVEELPAILAALRTTDHHGEAYRNRAELAEQECAEIEARAKLEGAKAMQKAALKVSTVNGAKLARSAIAALDPAQIVKDNP